MSGPPGSVPVARPTLPLARYRVRFRERVPERGSPGFSLGNRYLGSAWRGALGHALRKTVCVTGLPACDPCVLLRSCPYPFLFESRTPPGAKKLSRYPYTPGPYVLEPAHRHFDTDGDTLNLGITLFGSANDYLPYMVHALDRAGRRGLGARRVALEMLDVQAEPHAQAAGDTAAETGDARDTGDAGDSVDTVTDDARAGGVAHEHEVWSTIFTPGGALSPGTPKYPVVPALPPAVRVRLLTPLRVKRYERFVSASDFDFRAFAGGLLRRISLLTCFFSETPLETDFAGLLRCAESVPATGRTLHWREWSRHSSRQNTKLQMGGLVGSFELAGAGLEAFWPLLWLGQWTHSGKGCSMGLGRYALEPVGDRGPTGTDAGHWPAPSRL